MTDDHTLDLTGFGNYFQTEAIKDALPTDQNSPQKVAYDLYAEQISGTPFIMPRNFNLKAWLYRIAPSVKVPPFESCKQNPFLSFDEFTITPNPLRWDPLPITSHPQGWLTGMYPMVQNYPVNQREGGAIYLYHMNQSFYDNGHYFYNADGEFLVVPVDGTLIFKTEFGDLTVQPGEIIVIPRGIKYSVHFNEAYANGYICENYGQPFRLPELGLIGANGLANPRHFIYPKASFETKRGHFKLFCKMNQSLWQTSLEQSPLNVVAWQGNYAPYKYDLQKFNTINTVSFDHPDPSIFTVLTSPSHVSGIANIDFVIFPERWMVADHTFRPPYFHRNCMSEWMGLVYGQYDAKENDFIPGASSLHNIMTAHGPDTKAYHKATQSSLQPNYVHNTLAIMFESAYAWRVSKQALTATFRQTHYHEIWQDLPLPKHFS